MKKLIVLTLVILMIGVMPLTYAANSNTTSHHPNRHASHRVKNKQGAVLYNPSYSAPSGPVPYTGAQQGI